MKQGTAYMALGYALASGKTGVYVVVPGPGFLNTTAALSTAYASTRPSSASPARSMPTRLAAVTECCTKFPISSGFCVR